MMVPSKFYLSATSGRSGRSLVVVAEEAAGGRAGGAARRAGAARAPPAGRRSRGGQEARAAAARPRRAAVAKRSSALTIPEAEAVATSSVGTSERVAPQTLDGAGATHEGVVQRDSVAPPPSAADRPRARRGWRARAHRRDVERRRRDRLGHGAPRRPTCRGRPAAAYHRVFAVVGTRALVPPRREQEVGVDERAPCRRGSRRARTRDRRVLRVEHDAKVGGDGGGCELRAAAQTSRKLLPRPAARARAAVLSSARAERASPNSRSTARRSAAYASIGASLTQTSWMA